jgi:hypothetical protein
MYQRGLYRRVPLMPPLPIADSAPRLTERYAHEAQNVLDEWDQR